MMTNGAGQTVHTGKFLDGLRVLDLTDERGEVGPWLLAQLGASVVRLSSAPSSDYDRGKHRLDVANEPGRTDPDRLLELVAAADVVFESGASETTSAAGLERSDLLQANPLVVHVNVSAFGTSGPRSEQPASELTIAALSGVMSVQGDADRAPLSVSVPQVWRHAGAEAALAALIAVRSRDLDQAPQWVDVSAQKTMTWTMLNAMDAFAVQGEDLERSGQLVQLGTLRQAYFATLDGWTVMLPAGDAVDRMLDWFFEEQIVPDGWRDVDWDTYSHRLLNDEPVELPLDEVVEAIEQLCSRYTKNELLDRGLECDVPFAPVHTVADLLAFEQLDRRSFWDTEGSTSNLRLPGYPFLVNGARPAVAAAKDGDEIDNVWPAPTTRPLGTASPSSSEADTEPESPSEPPLAGVVVADFSWVGVGPITTKALADHGATVIRVESNGRPDILRVTPPFVDGVSGLNRSAFFGNFNTSKRSVAIDLTSEEGRGLARRMCEQADVVIDSFRPGTMGRLGLGPDDIHRVNPKAVVVSTSLLGAGGPLSSMAGYGTHAAAIAGFAELVGWPDRGPVGPWAAYTDVIAPRFLSTAIVAALDERDRTGHGVVIEGAQLELALQFLLPELLEYQRGGLMAQRRGNRHRSMAPQGAYPTKGDDRWLALTVGDDEDWRRLCELMGDSDLLQDRELATADGRLLHHDRLDARISAWTSQHDAAALEAKLVAHGIAAGVVQRSSDLVVDPQYDHDNFYFVLDHPETGPTRYCGPQYRIEGAEHGPRSAAPCLGADTYDVMTGLFGLSDEAFALAVAAGTLE